MRDTTRHADACWHKHTSLGSVYEYCEDCGAVRVRPELKPSDAAWHICDVCSLKRPASPLPPSPAAGGAR